MNISVEEEIGIELDFMEISYFIIRETSQLRKTNNWNIMMRSVMKLAKLGMKPILLPRDTQSLRKSRFLLLTKIFPMRKYMRPRRTECSVI